MDALVIRVREHDRTINVRTLVAVGVNADGGREVLGVEVTSDEDGAGWLAFPRSLTGSGLAGVRLVLSDAYRGLLNAIGVALPGAGWQRCRTALPAQPAREGPQDGAAVGRHSDPHHLGGARHRRRPCAIRPGPGHHRREVPDTAEHLQDAHNDLLAFTALTAGSCGARSGRTTRKNA
jgi:hypothetical protein